MANSSDSSEICQQNVSMDAEFSMNDANEQAESLNSSFIDVNQRILLPKDYVASSQLLQLKIRVPTVMLVNSDGNFELKEIDDSPTSKVIEYENVDLNNVKIQSGPTTSNSTDSESPKNAEPDSENNEMNSTASFFSFEKSSDGSFNTSRRQNYKKYISEITSPTALNTSFQAFHVSVHNKNFAENFKKPENVINPRMNKYKGFVKETVKFFENQAQEPPKYEPKRRRYTAPSNPKVIEEGVKRFFEMNDVRKIEFQKKPLLKSNRPKSAHGSVRRYLKRLDSKNGKEDSQIIQELVLNRYRNAWLHFAEKSERRRRTSTDEQPSNEKSEEWRDSGNNSIDEAENAFISCNFSASTSRADTLDSTFTIERISDTETKSDVSEPYDEQAFLDVALGSGVSSNTIDSRTSVPSCSSKHDEDSVGTSHLSQLISGAYDLYTTIDQTKRKNRQSIITYASINESRESMEQSRETSRKSGEFAVPMTESTLLESHETSATESDNAYNVNRKEEIVKYLMGELNKESTTICQISKALDLCGKVKDFYETCERIEAERVLLVATLRKEVIIEEMARVDYEDVHDQRCGNIRMSNIRIPLIWVLENNPKYSRFFVVVFRCGSTLLSSSLLTPNEETNLEVNKSLYFEDLPTDFEVTVYIYSMYAKINDKSKNSSVKSIKDCSKMFRGLKHMFSPKKKLIDVSIDNYSLKRPSFILYGKGSITRTTLQQGEFKIHNVFPRLPLANILKCEIDTIVKLGNKMSGFLTIGEFSNGVMIWNRQWCVMEAEELKFWDYPGKESEIAPNQIINLSRCLRQDIPTADKTLCPKPRTVYLELGPLTDEQEFRPEDHFLSMDDQKDFLMWKEELNAVLTTLIQWNCMRRYFYSR